MSDGIMDGQRAYERVQKKRIAAAAPELLEALERLLNDLEEHSTGSFGESEDAARAAIAKARGQ
jgi:hypothetical protein